MAGAACTLPDCCVSGRWSTWGTSIARSTRTNTSTSIALLGSRAAVIRSCGRCSSSSSCGRSGSRTRDRISQEMRHCLLPPCCLDGSGCLSLSQSHSRCRGLFAGGSGNTTLCMRSRSTLHYAARLSQSHCRCRCIASLAGAAVGDPFRLGGSASQAIAAASASAAPGNVSGVREEGSDCHGRSESPEQEQEQQRQQQKQSAEQHHDAIIVGGGLAGLATAIALRRHGLDAHVYEKRESIGGGEGTLILLFRNGLHALNQICPEIIPKLMDTGCCDPSYQLVGPDGTPMPTSPAPPVSSAQQAAPRRIAIRWRAVLDLLQQQLPPHCIHLDHGFESLEQEEDGSVTVRFCRSDGSTAQASAPVVIGADGIRSAVRNALFGSGQEDVRDMGRMLWRTMVEFDKGKNIPGVRRNTSSLATSRGKSVVLTDAGSDVLYIAFAVLDSAWPDAANTDTSTTTVTSSPPTDSDPTKGSTHAGNIHGGGASSHASSDSSDAKQPRRSKDGAEAVERLRELFQGWTVVQRILEIVEPEKILERRVLDLRPIESWVKGSVLLIGDAAHALTPAIGQGANLAFEDAWELGEFLHAAGSVRDALCAFESVRMPRAYLIANENNAYAKKMYSEDTALAYEGLKSREEFMFGYKGVNHAHVLAQKVSAVQ